MSGRLTPDIRVTDAAGAAAADADAIAQGIPSRALMQRAGAAAAAEIASRFAPMLAQGVVVATGPGNNGGDGWVVAQALHAVGVRVRVVECVPARTPDAIAERQSAVSAGVRVDADIDALLSGGERLVVDALLGTGMRSDQPLRGGVLEALARLRALQERGAAMVALDVPTGVDASNGLHTSAVPCALTLTFGTLKRAHLILRELCGDIALLDIGLGAHAALAGGARLATPEWFRAALPAISASAHKGTRKKIAVLGGSDGMAGAVTLAARAALRSGAGMVKCVVTRESVSAIQEIEPAALTAPWPASDDELRSSVTGWADVMLIGPGLGHARGRELVERALRVFDGPVVIDADALNVFASDVEALATLIGSRQALLTPHPLEFARLAGMQVDEVLLRRFDVPAELAARARAAVLLKGVPTTIAGVDGETFAIAAGTPILATGGSGDVLGGIAATLLAQMSDALVAGALAAFAHGEAAQMVSGTAVRGYTLDDVLQNLPAAWSMSEPPCRPPLLAELRAVGERA